MPVFEVHGTRQGRWRAFRRAQLPLLLGASFVTVQGEWVLPEVAWTAPAVTGLVMIMLASLLFVGLPWERWPAVALMPLAGIDVVAVAFIRLAYFDDLPSVGLLAIFPVVWLVYTFRRWVIGVAVMGTLVITFLPAFVERRLPATPLEVASVVTLPVLICGFAFAVGEAARQLRASQQDARDTNDQLQASLRQARDSEHLSRTLFESVEVALAFFDTDRKVVMANALVERAADAAGFDLDEEPYAGPRVRHADNRTPIPYEEQIIPRALRGDLHNHQMEWIGPPGNQTAIVASAQQVLRADGRLWGTLIVLHDLTELARSLQVKDEFVATVSHELRTPLTTIIGYLEILDEELIDQPTFITTSFETIHRSALKLQARIKELLDTADLRRELSLQTTDLSALAQRMKITFGEQAKAAGIDLVIVAATPCFVTVDPAKIEQAIENLVSNAVKYTTSGGQVTITVTYADETASVEVTDTGIGMSPDEQKQAFTSFWRAVGVRDQAIQGIGIGLGLVRSITEAHHGTIALASEPGTGTTLTLTLPHPMSHRSQAAGG